MLVSSTPIAAEVLSFAGLVLSKYPSAGGDRMQGATDLFGACCYNLRSEFKKASKPDLQLLWGSIVALDHVLTTFSDVLGVVDAADLNQLYRLVRRLLTRLRLSLVVRGCVRRGQCQPGLRAALCAPCRARVFAALDVLLPVRMLARELGLLPCPGSCATLCALTWYARLLSCYHCLYGWADCGALSP